MVVVVDLKEGVAAAQQVLHHGAHRHICKQQVQQPGTIKTFRDPNATLPIPFEPSGPLILDYL